MMGLALLAALTVSCTRQTHLVNQSATQARTPVPAPTVWDRQVRNAVDAGDGDYQLRVLRDKMAAEPDNIQVRVDLAGAYHERGYPDVALEISRLAVDRFPDSGVAQLALVRALRQVGRRAEAIAGLEGFLKSHPGSAAEYFSWLGILRDESGLWPLGEPAHRKALELAPAADYLHNNLGYNLLMQNRNDEAAAEFAAALKLNPGSQMARNNLGLALANSNAAAEALANWQATGGPATAHNNLATVYLERGNYAEARKELDLALSYNRAHSAALKNLELLGRMDGKPATLTARPAEARSRWKAAVRKLFVGPLNDSRPEAAQTASGPVAKGEQ
jgi:Flp pilus assembly protein TadD